MEVVRFLVSQGTSEPHLKYALGVVAVIVYGQHECLARQLVRAGEVEGIPMVFESFRKLLNFRIPKQNAIDLTSKC